jgi:hypothetical protein
MTARTTERWPEANQRYLTAALGLVRLALEQHAARADETPLDNSKSETAKAVIEKARRALPAPSALDTLCSAFGLSPFERDVVLLCAGVELDSRFGPLWPAVQGDRERRYPTFSLALAALPDPHWSALAPAAPLRYWRLIEVGSGSALTSSALRIDERVLHYLTGVQHLDERLAGLIEPLSEETDVVPSHGALAERLAAALSRAGAHGALPVANLYGFETTGKRAIAATACAAIGMHLCRLSASDVPAAPSERVALARLWEREAVLSGSALLVDCELRGGSEGAERAVSPFLESVRGVLIVASREPWRQGCRPMVRLEVKRPTAAEQRGSWESALGPLAHRLNGRLETVTAQFSLDTEAIRAASSLLGEASQDDEPLGARLWAVCRAQARPQLDDLAQRIEAAAAWDDLVLPEPQRQILREIAVHMRNRAKVYETWGFAARTVRGLGISVLFSGASGTGKTMAAEVLANELALDLYRIDLSQVVSKYIGETEKNLRRVFDAAEEGGAILLFDEADALFGKRSEVRDSHDRYANIEISYLLQRMEAYRGLAILTTNMKSALDPAFLRRLRFVVHFPFPDAAQRVEIWRRVFPHETPAEALDVAKLARLNVAGGNIRNIALNAAFLAADVGQPVRMTHLLRAARAEYAKLERPLTEAEIGGWA